MAADRDFQTDDPRLSVIVASYNSAGMIENCLASLRRQVTEEEFDDTDVSRILPDRNPHFERSDRGLVFHALILPVAAHRLGPSDPEEIALFQVAAGDLPEVSSERKHLARDRVQIELQVCGDSLLRASSARHHPARH